MEHTPGYGDGNEIEPGVYRVHTGGDFIWRHKDGDSVLMSFETWKKIKVTFEMWRKSREEADDAKAELRTAQTIYTRAIDRVCDENKKLSTRIECIEKTNQTLSEILNRSYLIRRG